MSLRVYSCSEPMIASLKLHWADRSGYFVGGNMVVRLRPIKQTLLTWSRLFPGARRRRSGA